MNDNAAVSKTPSVAVVILNWNGKLLLEKFLPSVIKSSYANLRIIVADNASSDDSAAFILENFPSVELINNEENFGFAKGYNIALCKIKSDYYVLLNSDVEVAKDWIEPVISLMEKDDLIAACQPKILSFKNKKMFEYAGACGGWIDNFGYPFARGRVFDRCEEDKGQYDGPSACFWASGAALFVRSSLYHEIGGLDEFFFAHQEEIDFCWRLQRAGYKIFVQPASVVYHVGGGTLPQGNSRKTFLNFRNNLVMLSKNLSGYKAVWKIIFRIFLDVVSACKELVSGDAGYFMAVLKAHLHFLKWLLFKRKSRPFRTRSFHGFTGIYNGLIVWDYFIKKRKTFSEIIKSK